MNPVWVGRRRWTMTRRKYKKLMRRQGAEQVEQTWDKIRQRWGRSSAVIGTALQELEWPRVHAMESVTAYQTQNIIKLKLGKLRVWTGAERGFRCARAECARQSDTGPAHLIWECPDAQEHWGMVRRQWGGEERWPKGAAKTEEEVMREIFSFSIRDMPQWTAPWRQAHPEVTGETMREVLAAMWTLCCAETTTAIWRWNVNRVHQEEHLKATREAAIEALRRGVSEAMTRYRSSLYPLTQRSHGRIQVAEEVSRRWRQDREGEQVRVGEPDHSAGSGGTTQGLNGVSEKETSKN